MEDLERKNYLSIAQSFGIAGIMIFLMIISSTIPIILKNFINKDAILLITYVISVGLAFWIAYLIRKRKTSETKFNFKIENKRIIPFIILTVIFLNFGINSPIISLIPMPEYIQKLFAELLGQYGLYSFILVVVAAPVLEELIFRGIILDGLLKKYSPLKAILISSFLFGLVHLNPWQFISAFSIGVFAGWIYYKTKNLTFAIIIHAANNFAGFLAGYFSDSDSFEINENLIEIYGGALNLVLVLVGSFAIILISVYYLHNFFKKNKKDGFLPIIIVLLITIFLLSVLLTDNINQSKKENVSISLEDCYQKNIETSTLMTGLYYTANNTDTIFRRQIVKTEHFLKINPLPIVTSADFRKVSIKIDDLGNKYLLIYLNSKFWNGVTKNAIGKHILLIVNDQLIYTGYINKEIFDGCFSMFGTYYTKEELEEIKQTIEKNRE